MSPRDWPTPWKVERSPQTNGTIGWSVLDADDTEIVTVWDKSVARLVARAGLSVIDPRDGRKRNMPKVFQCQCHTQAGRQDSCEFECFGVTDGAIGERNRLVDGSDSRCRCEPSPGTWG